MSGEWVEKGTLGGGGGAGIDDGVTGPGSVWSSQKTATELDGKAPKASPTFTGTVTTPGLKVTTGAAAGRVLTSGADGTASWSEPASSGAPGVAVNGVSGAPATASATGDRSIAIGGTANASNGGAAVGVGATASVNGAIAAGAASSASGGTSSAFGATAAASGTASTAVGGATKALHTNSTAIGYLAQTTAADQVMLGRSASTVVAPNKLQIGPDGANSAVLSTRANGSGKTELVVQFATGNPVVIATQP